MNYMDSLLEHFGDETQGWPINYNTFLWSYQLKKSKKFIFELENNGLKLTFKDSEYWIVREDNENF